ncbi:MAG: TolC family protein [Gemmataceae bacterium]
MRQLRPASLAAAALLAAGCATPPHPPPVSVLPPVAPDKPRASVESPVKQAAFAQAPAPTAQTSTAPPTAVAPAAAAPKDFGRERAADAVVAEVLAQNPTVAQMAAAVQVAQARYPQVTSLDDPVFSSWVAPASLGSNKVNDSARFEVSQKFSLFGKRAQRGEVAQAQATAAGHDLEDTKLQLVESAKTAYADYFLAERALEVNVDGRKLLEEFKGNAETRYKTGQTPQQDVLQADVELGRQSEQRLALERSRAVAVARLNTLMNRPPDAPLPPPAKEAGPKAALPEAKALRELAVARRPDLQALAARVAADAASVGVAEKEYYPDVEAMAAYDSFWPAADDQQRLRPQVGVRMNLPLRLERRRGAVSEAVAQLAQRRAQLAQQQNQVAFDVQQAYEQVRESEQAVKLYAEKILPAARENVKSAQAGYVTGKIPFLTLVEAQRSLVDLRDRSYLAAADYERRRATLERVVGGPLQSPVK